MSVSIIIPYFKKKKYIEKTIKSILKQSFKNFEIILINDEQSYESRRILSNIKKKDKRIKVFYNKKNIGAGFSRNYGIKKAKNKYIAFIDSDDLWTKNKLKNQINFMKKYNLKVSHTSYFIINENGKKIGLRKSKNLTIKELQNSCDIGLSTVIIEKKLFKKDNFFSNFKTKEDYYLWLKLSKKGEIFNYYNEPMTLWRKTDNSLSSSTIQKLYDAYKVYFYYEKKILYSLIKTLILSLNYLRKKINES